MTAATYPLVLRRADVKSEAEFELFHRLRDELPDAWSIFHSVGLVVRDAGDGARDDEVDLVLVHPEMPVIALEVKGGGLECRHGTWFERGSEDTPEHQVKDPFQQAADHKFSLIRKLEEHDRKWARGLEVVHALGFPRIAVPELVLAPDAPAELIIDRADVRDDLPGAIDRVVAYWRGQRGKKKPPGPDGVERIREILAPDFTLRPTLGDQVRDDDAALVRLTNEQAAALRGLRHNRRVLVTGCAGSGKTMLALARARELAEDGKRVLFVCFNKALCHEVARRALTDEDTDVYTFHSLCVRQAKVHSINLPSYEGSPPQEYWEDVLPDALVSAMDEIGGEYDAVLVDEAQDLKEHWLTALECTLRDERTGSIWLFLDDNQRVYDSDLEVPAGYVRYDLTVNCRNTRAIHREVMKLYEGDALPEVAGPEGRPIDLRHTKNQPKEVEAVLRRLIEKDGVAAQDIVVLSSHAIEKSEVAARSCKGFEYTKERGKLGSFVQFSSIRAFKGLESPVVVLCELEDLDGQSEDAQLYVGMSRATSHCIVVAPAGGGT